MAIYAIGDVQGCYDQLQQLLALIAYDDARDTLWFAGDLVNRGPKSLETLRFIHSLPPKRTQVVLGNHDLHLLAVATGVVSAKKKDNFTDILQAPDAPVLLNWLRQQPLLHHDKTQACLLVHAGLPPQWDLPLSVACARELETALRSDAYPQVLKHLYGNEPSLWSEKLLGWDRLRFIANSLTRIRFCHEDGRIDLENKGGLSLQKSHYYAWFNHPKRLTADISIIMGHWASLQAMSFHPRIFAIDAGCAWGGFLTALRLEDKVRFQVPGLSGI